MTFAIETWPLARIEVLTSMRAAGVSCAAIANELSARDGVTITRNAVIGKIHRLGLPPLEKPEPSEETKTRKQRRREQQNGYQRNRRRRYASQNPVAFKAFIPRPPRAEKRKMYGITELPPLNLTIADLTFKDGLPVECRFITSDDLANATYCGIPADDGCSWCAYHRLILQPPKGWVAPSHAPKMAAAA